MRLSIAMMAMRLSMAMKAEVQIDNKEDSANKEL